MDNFKSSDDVLAAINDLANGIPEGGGEEQERYSFPEVLPDPVEQYLDDDGRQEVDRLESDANLREQWKADETARMQHEYAMTGEVPQFRTYDEWRTHREIVEPQQNMQRALAQDLADLQERYPKAYPHFLRKMNLGRVVVPDDIMNEPNALEQLLIQTVVEDARKMDAQTLAEVIGHAETEDERRQPLRSRSADIAEPRRVPIKQAPVRSRQKQQTYKMPDLSQDDFNEMFRDWAIKHPEKMRGR